jgi:hypothetical protein
LRSDDLRLAYTSAVVAAGKTLGAAQTAWHAVGRWRAERSELLRAYRMVNPIFT